MKNISMIAKKLVNFVKSDARRIVYECIRKCDFSLTWKLVNDKWCVPENGIIENSYSFEDALNT